MTGRDVLALIFRQPVSWFALMYILSFPVELPGTTLELPPNFTWMDIPGLPEEAVYHILQDDAGFLWFSTENGLYRYDGYELRPYKYVPYDTTSLTSNALSYVAMDSRQNLWIDARHSGVNRLNLVTGQFTHFQHDPSDSNSIDSNRLFHLFESSSGDRWLMSYQGINRLVETRNPRDGTITEEFRSVDYAGTLQWEQLRDNNDLKLSDRNCALFNASFIYLDQSRERFYRIRFDRLLPPDDVLMWMHIDGQRERLWLLTENLHLYAIPWSGGEDRSWSLVQLDASLISELENIRRRQGKAQFYLDHEERVWLLTVNSGVRVFELESRKYQHFYDDGTVNRSLNGNRPFSFLLDSSNTVWIGTDTGLNKLYLTHKGIHHIKPFPDQPAGNPGNRIGAFVELNGGEVWICTPQGNYLFDEKSMTIDTDAIHPIFTKQLRGVSIRSVYQDHHGRYWLGASRGNLYEYNIGTGKLSEYILPLGHRTLVRTIAEGQRGNILFGGDVFNDNIHGLHLLRPADGLIEYLDHEPGNPYSLSSNVIWSIAHYHGNLYWIGTWGGGLVLFNTRSGRCNAIMTRPSDPNSISDNFVTDMCEDMNGDWWFGTWNGGLNKLTALSTADHTSNTHEITSQFLRFTERDGLTNNTIMNILDDEQGNLWLATGSGISRLNTKTQTFTNFDMEDGVQGKGFIPGACLKSGSGHLYFGGSNGFNVFHPAAIRGNQHIPPVIITSFTLFGESAEFDTLISRKNRIILNHNDNYFSFEFAALDFVFPAKNQYMCQLEGFDQQWVDCGTRRFKSYTNVPPGKYTFRMKGSNSDGVWNERGTTLAVVIRPPFWRTWWFQLVWIGGLIGLIGLSSRVIEYYRVYQKTRYIGHFKVIRKLGSGGMGTVYKAWDKLARRVVAVKILNEDLEDSREGVKRFLQEAEIGSVLNHPNIVRIHEVGKRDKIRYISMEYIEGKTLKEHIREQGTLHPEEVLRIAEKILDGLREIHRNGIVHRDLKPGNVIIDGNGQIKIMDFGLARLNILTSMHSQIQMAGTLAYMSPEQTIGRDVDHRSDIYSFGLILYEMVFGEPPFRGNNEMELIFAIHNEIPDQLSTNSPEVPKSITQIIEKCIRKDQSERYATVNKLLVDLRRSGALSSAPDEEGMEK